MKDEKENRYIAGDTVCSKINPEVKLVVRRYVQKIYYCQFPNEPERKELVFFDRDLV